jgi:hypothetical protein
VSARGAKHGPGAGDVGAELRDRLRGAPMPGSEDARRRAWGVVRAAAPPPRRSRRRRRVAAALLAVAAVTFALTPPGAAVGEWVRARVDPPEPVAQPAATPAVRLPATGKLLVRDSRGAAVVGQDGDRVRLGRYDGATWSPHGMFVAAWRGSRLAALTPAGDVRWALTAPAPVVAVRWSPDPGYRVAYVTAGGALRIVAGDGSGDRPFARLAPQVAPAWRPGAPTVLAYVGARGRLEVRDVDSGALIARPRGAVPRGTHTLSWSAGGQRIAAAAPGALRVFDLRRNRSRRIAPPPRARYTAAAYAPTHATLALVTTAQGRSRVVAGREVFSTRGRIAGLAWSADGRWLMLDATDAGQLVAVRVVGRPRVLSFPGGRLDGWSP